LRIIVLVVIGFFVSSAGQTFECQQGIRYFQHTAWTLSEGAPPDVWALAQSPDGYLWLGTGAGLYRFDGVRFERIRATAGVAFPAVDITALLATPSGDIWIGYQNGGVSLLRDGGLVNFKEGVPKGPVRQFAEDQDHAIWMMADFGLARFTNGRWQEIGSDWDFPARSGNALFVARDGTLWVTVSWGKSFFQEGSELVFLRRGSHHFEIYDRPVMVAAALAQAADGGLWVSDRTQGAREIDLNRVSSSSKQHPNGHQPAWDFRPLNIIFDDEGGLWGIHHLGGIFRRQLEPQCLRSAISRDASPMETIGLKDGLTSDISASLLKDREGNIWVGTNLGLDRFRRANVVAEKRTLTAAPEGYRETPGPDGTVYVTSAQRLLQIAPNGSVRTVFRSPSPIVFLRTSKDYETIWLGTQTGLLRMTRGRWTRVSLPKVSSSSFVWKFEGDPSGACWIAMWREGIFRLEGGVWKKFEPSSELSHLAPMLMTADFQGREWLYYSGGPLVLVDNSRVRIFHSADGPTIGDIQVIRATRTGVLLAGEFGVASFDGERFHALHSSVIPPLSRITGVVQTAGGETWMNGIMGVVRVTTRELNAALADSTHARSLSYQLLDFRDGLPGLAQQDSFEPTAVEGSDHRLWFITNHGLAWADPAHMTRNPLPPPVLIRSVTAGGVQYAYQPSVTFQKHITDLQVDYTALSLSIPERVRFRYMLEGVDTHWIDPSARRQAFYTNLSPGTYQFRVIAANNDGVWNTTGASVDLFVPPTFMQSKWFELLCLAAGLLVVWLLYSLRLRQISARLTDRSLARLAERERIARELHDTLLQGFQALILRFQAVAERLPLESSVRPLMNEVLELAKQVVVEGRERVRNLRGIHGKADLAEAFRAAAESFAPHSSAAFRIATSGPVRDIAPIVIDEIVKVGNEAIFNAFQHAEAEHIEVTINYDSKRLRIRFGDDGVGIDSDVIEGGGKPNHFGLTGMRERARRIHAELRLVSEPGKGTQIELTIPGRIAYATTPRTRSRGLFRRISINED
jgi:signal transduction histidine kinase/ligand-binding sensor domain-containing protein